jgi:hypothetical protein
MEWLRANFYSIVEPELGGRGGRSPLSPNLFAAATRS